MPGGPSLTESQPTSIQRSDASEKLSSVAQSIVWMVTPLPVVMMPTMRSPGRGWQQRAKCTAMPGISPLMAIWPVSSFLARLAAFGGLVARPRDRHHVRAARLACLLQARIDRGQHLARADQARPDIGDQIVGGGLLEVGLHAVQALVGDFVALLVEGLVQERLAELQVLLALARADEPADGGLGLAGDGEALPGRRRRLGPRGHDLDLVAVGELGAERQHAAVDLGADAGVADLAVHGVGEIDGSRSARQGDQFALGREAE